MADSVHPIRAFRAEHGLTQAQLGEKLGGVSFVTVSRWETGQREPRGRELERLTEVTGIPMEVIVRAGTARQPEIAQ